MQTSTSAFLCFFYQRKCLAKKIRKEKVEVKNLNVRLPARDVRRATGDNVTKIIMLVNEADFCAIAKQ